jgi:hypothetical protein
LLGVGVTGQTPEVLDREEQQLMRNETETDDPKTLVLDEKKHKADEDEDEYGHDSDHEHNMQTIIPEESKEESTSRYQKQSFPMP